MIQCQYVHFQNWLIALKKILCCFYGNLQGTVEYSLLINIDGLPLFQSPDFKLYPVLVTVYGCKMRPLCVGIYSTEKSTNRNMPEPRTFLDKFLSDLVTLKSSCIISNDVPFKLANNGVYICDAPARSSLKKIKTQTAYSGCEKCMVVEEYAFHSRHVCFLETNCKL